MRPLLIYCRRPRREVAAQASPFSPWSLPGCSHSRHLSNPAVQRCSTFLANRSGIRFVMEFPGEIFSESADW